MQKEDPKVTIESLASALLKRRDEAIKHRVASGVERRWLEDEAAYDGIDAAQRRSMMDYVTGVASLTQKKKSRSEVVVNIIRGKCEQTSGRFADIQLPVDDRNWGLTITPVPELVMLANDKSPVAGQDGQPAMKDGKPVTVGDVANDKLKTAQKKMEGMEKEIDDQLNECGFNGECRKVLFDAVKLGTGILKGPGVVKRLKKAWREKEGTFVLSITEEDKPFSRRVDPWNCYPDAACGDDIAKAGEMWERDSILPRDLRRLIGVDGYIQSQIMAVLREEPVTTTTTISKKEKELEVKQLAGKQRAYELWEYHGDLTVEELALLGYCDDDLNGSVSACVVFVNDRPIKAVLNLLDTGDLPYDFFQWSKVSDSVWGIGVSRVLMWWQKILTAAWRMILDNGKNSTRGHVVKADGLEMVDNTGSVTEWRMTGDQPDIRQAFGIFYFPTNQADLQRIIELALKFVDLETSLPMAFNGEQVGQAETLGAVELKVDSSNVGIRSRVKLWDDQITRPHLTRYYHWNMQYNENEEIKGDYNVDPRGVSVLLTQDRAAQSILQLMGQRGDPVIGGIVDWVKAIKQLMAAQKIDILLPDAEIDAFLENMKNNPPPQDPRIAAADIRAKADVQKAEMTLGATQGKVRSAMSEAELDRQHELELAMISRQTEMLRLAAKEDMTLDQIKAKLASDFGKLDLQRELSGRAQVITPPMEPEGRARDGHAFEE